MQEMPATMKTPKQMTNRVTGLRQIKQNVFIPTIRQSLTNLVQQPHRIKV